MTRWLAQRVEVPRWLLIIVGIRMAAAIIGTAGAAADPLPGPYPAEVLRVVDGDTVEARVSIWPSLAVTTGVRLAGIDTPELRARCPDEKTAAVAARDALVTLLHGRAVSLHDVEQGKFAGRVVARVDAAGQDVGAALVAMGLARRYDGGRRAGWCE